MKNLLIFAGLMMLPCGMASGYSDWLDGNDLLKDCSRVDTAAQKIKGMNSTEIYEGGECYGYVTGMVSALQWVGWNDGKCYIDPGNKNAYALIDLVVDYLKKNPKERGLGASQIIGYVMRENFPCPK